MKLMVMIDGPMINNFIENSEEFDKYAEEKFKSINQSEQKAGESMAMDGEESQDDRLTAVDLEGYKAGLKEMMKAVAKGIGNTPVNVLIGEESFLSKVSEFESARIIQEKEEEMRKMKMEEEREREINSTPKKVQIMDTRKVKKKNSFDFLNFCACSGKQFAQNN